MTTLNLIFINLKIENFFVPAKSGLGVINFFGNREKGNLVAFAFIFWKDDTVLTKTMSTTLATD